MDVKKVILNLSIAVCVASTSYAQNAGIGTNTPSSSAMLEIKSNDKELLIPRTSTTTRITIAGVKGLMLYDTTTNSFWYHDGSNWLETSTTLKGWNTGGNTGTNPATNFIGTSDNTDIIFKRNNTRSGLLSEYNTSYGVNALNELSTGTNNTSFGFNSLFKNTTGNPNTAVDVYALENDTTGGTTKTDSLILYL
jgi:trimeric autotransporter adhesin